MAKHLKIRFKFKGFSNYIQEGVFVCTDSIWNHPGYDGVYAITKNTWFANSGRIEKSRIFINIKEFSYGKKSNRMKSVLLHEVGHVLGLRHSDDKKSVMYPYNKMKQSLTGEDILRIKKLYR